MLIKLANEPSLNICLQAQLKLRYLRAEPEQPKQTNSPLVLFAALGLGSLGFMTKKMKSFTTHIYLGTLKLEDFSGILRLYMQTFLLS